MNGSTTRIRREEGFTYLAMLFMVVVLGLTLSVTAELWQTSVKREKEAELLFVGTQYVEAIERYYASSPGLKVFPRKLEHLIEDPRQSTVTRHLRKLYKDPVTRKFDWELIKEKDGSIIGVKSRSRKKTLKRANFPKRYEGFEDALTYNDWAFYFDVTDRSGKKKDKRRGGL